MKSLHPTVFALLALAAPAASGEPASFLEEYALAPDRAAVLGKLLPGTEDDFYYRTLHTQTSGDLPRAAEILREWESRLGKSDRLEIIQNRQILLEYPADPKKSLDTLREKLDLRFNHEKEDPAAAARFPSVLDESAIARDRLIARALEKKSLGDIADEALPALPAATFEPMLLREWLGRLKRPDVPNLAALVAKDLRNPESAGFGSLDIHKRLILPQIEALAGEMPGLLAHDGFLAEWMKRLAPPDGADTARDGAERSAHIARLLGFCQRLTPAQTPLKIHVLYHALAESRARGTPDRALFLEYLGFPRNSRVVPISRKPETPAELPADLRKATGLPPAGDDTALVRALVKHFLAVGEPVETFVPFFEENFFAELAAETYLETGSPEATKWAARLAPEKIRAMKEETVIEFSPANRTMLRRDEPVRLEVALKNASPLLVRIYALDPARGENASRPPDLDGAAPTFERTLAENVPAGRRIAKSLDFPELAGPGAWVVELLGGDKRASALVRKGRLRFATRPLTEGLRFTVFDEEGRRSPGAIITITGREYRTDENGRAIIPYSKAPGRETVGLVHGNLATAESFYYPERKFTLKASIAASEEGLLAGREGRLVIRPCLLVNDTPVSLKTLTETRLALVLTDTRGTKTRQEVKNLSLSDDSAFVYSFLVPGDPGDLEVTLSGKIGEETLDVRRELNLDGIGPTVLTSDIHLLRNRDGYVLECLGKNGEPKPRHILGVSLRHNDLKNPTHVSLQTDDAGRVRLGQLPGIAWVEAGPVQEIRHRRWHLGRRRADIPALLQVPAGAPLTLPVPEDGPFALIELRHGANLADRSSLVETHETTLTIQDIPPGIYDLLGRDASPVCRIVAAEGAIVDANLITTDAALETRTPPKIALGTPEVREKDIRVRVSGATTRTRIHVLATRFIPNAGTNLLDLIALPDPRDPSEILQPRPLSVFLPARGMDGEHRYILERRRAKKFAGNMLERPGLLLVPFALAPVENPLEDIGIGGGAGGTYSGLSGGKRNLVRRGGGSRATSSATPTLDFLRDPAVFLPNLKPDADGWVTVERKLLGDKLLIQLAAVDGDDTVLAETALPDVPVNLLDLRLARALDPAKSFIEDRNITALLPGDTLTLEDPAASRQTRVDSMAAAWDLFDAVNPDGAIHKFRFLLEWPALTEARKRELYSKFACHEVNLFLSRKDPAFFGNVIRPFLANKKDKTFPDLWLLGEDLLAFLEPWAFDRLNAAEKALLAWRMPAAAPAIRRRLVEEISLIPRDVAREGKLFDAALGLGTLEKPKTYYRYTPMQKDDEAKSAATPAPKPARDLSKSAEKEKREAATEEKAPVEDALEVEGEMPVIEAPRPLYTEIARTTRWAENNYDQIPPDRNTGELVPLNRFWADAAAHDPAKGLFLSTHLAEATGTAAERMMALALTDLPFSADPAPKAAPGGAAVLKSATPLLVYRKILREAPAEPSALLVGQHFFRHGDREEWVDGEKRDKFVREEFLMGVPYGCEVTVANPTGRAGTVSVLLQIPAGAVPVKGGFLTRALEWEIPPYTTKTETHHFYFPAAGDFAHHPVQVARKGVVVAAAASERLRAVATATREDRTAWDFVARSGSAAEVLDWLRNHSLAGVSIEKAAFRLKNPDFFRGIAGLLRERRCYNETVWSYGLLHNDPAAIAEYLAGAPFAERCGRYLRSPLLLLDPVARGVYAHIEFKPLVHPRVHRVRGVSPALAGELLAQYEKFLAVLAEKPALDDADRLAAAYYLLLQDRREEGAAMFATVNSGAVATRLQYDYMQAWLAFSAEDMKTARAAARKYADYPVDRWREAFAEIARQLDEAEGRAVASRPADAPAALAASEPSLDLAVEGKTIILRHKNLATCRLSFRPMDVEVLFSRPPFNLDAGETLRTVRPAETREIKLSSDGETRVEAPASLAAKPVLVEATAAGWTFRRSAPILSANLSVLFIGNYGEIAVRDARGKPVPKAYVKVYTREKGGGAAFYKDGYTDLRGRFDYATLAPGTLDAVEKFAILVLDETRGAVVREADPPKR